MIFFIKYKFGIYRRLVPPNPEAVRVPVEEEEEEDDLLEEVVLCVEVLAPSVNPWL